MKITCERKRGVEIYLSTQIVKKKERKIFFFFTFSCVFNELFVIFIEKYSTYKNL